MTSGRSLWLAAGLMMGASMLLHCGSDDSGSGGSGGSGGGGAGSPGAGPISGDTECYNCAKASCSTELDGCYGAGWETGAWGGTCGPLIQCTVQCGSNVDCLQGCQQYSTTECEACSDAASTCIDGACPSCD